MPSSPLWRLLRRNISAGQTAGYILANLTGLAIVLVAMQFYRDMSTAASGPDSFMEGDYMIISKHVEGLQGINLPGGEALGMGDGGAATAFTAAEQADIASQPWASAVGAFTAADFDVWARVELGGRPVSTALFLESIPDDFFDITPQGWGYEPGRSPWVPLVLSRDYLTLYNFGYASSRGLPQVSEDVVGLLPVRLGLSGPGGQQWLEARIVGFSSRLNTIAVPEQFMRWANGELGGSFLSNPSRLIVKLARAGDPDAAAYMRAHGYDVAGDRADSGKAMYFLSIITWTVGAVGAVICVLSLFILLLSIYLLLQKNRAQLHRLLELGYPPRAITRVYAVLAAAAGAVVYVLACVVTAFAAGAWGSSMARLGAEGASLWPTFAAGLAVMVAVTLIDIAAISRKVKDAFH